jgi:mycothiol synthase
MLIRITNKISLRVARPLWIEISKQPQLELQLPKSIKDLSIPELPFGYVLRTLQPNDTLGLMNLFANAGFIFNNKQLEEILSACLPQGCFVVEHIETNVLVSTMMARHMSSPEHPFGGRIDWLATDPEHQGKGLGNICARSATSHLLKLGYSNIWVTTDFKRIAALKIFLSIGFEPVIKKETKSRWEKIIKQFKL